MDGLSALSVTASVAQFIQFGASLVSKSKEIYQSANGIPIQQAEAVTAAARLADLSQRIKLARQIEPRGTRGNSVDERALEAICDGCITVSQALISKLDKLKLDDARKYRKFKSFRQALKSVWSKGAVDEIARRLIAFQKELDQHLLVSLSEKFNSLTILHDETFDSLDQPLRQSIKTFLPHLVDIHDKMEQVVALQQKVLDIHEREGFINTHKEELSEAASEREEAYGAADTRILQNLWYPEMTYRHKEIEEAHRKTFAWILKHNPDTLLCAKPGCQGRAWHNFTKWLKEPGELYWINGKAGSGKSTLVRYICDNTTTRKYLESWAGVLKHQMISFYFWSSGSNEQCSQIGLLRSLLHQILKIRPALIRIVFEEEWDNLVLSQNSSKFTGRVWSFSQLEHAIYEALRLIENESMMSVFIDGLDEFEGNPEEVERLVGLVKTISGFPNVKVCLSSRPWRVFEEHFEGYPGLRLQDLTYEDIRLYVQDRVGENGKMLRLARSQPPQAADLVHKIVTKANGVFLWVKLAVWSLLDGLRNQDDIQELQERLDRLPSDLDTFYRQMLQRINPIYMTPACRILQIFNTYSDLQIKPTVLELELAVTSTYGDIMKAHRAVMSDQEISKRCERMSTHIQTRCGGLLEVHDLRDQHWESVDQLQYNGTSALRDIRYRRVKADLRVSYLHRTVRDFLAVESVRAILLDHTGPIAQFEPNMSLLMGYVMNLKRGIQYFSSAVSTSLDLRVWKTLAEVFRIAQNVPSECAYPPILDEFSRAAFDWASHSSGRRLDLKEWHAAVVSSAVAFGLTPFVQMALIKDSLYSTTQLAMHGVCLMARALGDMAGLLIFEPGIYHEVPLRSWPLFPSMVSLLLRYKADPNEPDQKCISTFTMWEFAVYSYSFALCLPDSRESEQENAWAEIVQIMLGYGADHESRCDSNHYARILIARNRGYTSSEFRLLQSNDGRPLLRWISELRLERGMRPFCHVNNPSSSVDELSKPRAAGLMLPPPIRRGSAALPQYKSQRPPVSAFKESRNS